MYIFKSKHNFKSEFKSKCLNQMSCLNSILRIKRYGSGAAEMAQWFLQWAWIQFPASTFGSLQLPISLAPGL